MNFFHTCLQVIHLVNEQLVHFNVSPRVSKIGSWGENLI